jgi:tellurite methyltransferase
MVSAQTTPLPIEVSPFAGYFVGGTIFDYGHPDLATNLKFANDANYGFSIDLEAARMDGIVFVPDTLFTISFGAGIKHFFTPYFGLRFDARGYTSKADATIRNGCNPSDSTLVAGLRQPLLSPVPTMLDLVSLFGQIDIYLFDQILRGRIAPGMRILDAGCGGGRNLVYFLQQGYDVCAVDADPVAIQSVRTLARRLAPRLPEFNFRAETVEASMFPDHTADVVLSSAVLHFARDEPNFAAMLAGSWRLVRPGGLFFCRLASSIGMEGRFLPLGNGRYKLPDGSERFLVDEGRLLALTAELGGELVGPLKTTVVQDQRCMTTWVVRRTGG